MRFLCLGYSDEKNWVAIPQSELEAILAYVDALRRDGHHWENGQALQSTRTAKTIRWQGGKVVVTDGPYAETKEQLGGFTVFEADDMDQAIELMKKHPCARLGSHEIRPADEEMNAECGGAAASLNIKQGTMTFVCLGYIDEKERAAISKSELQAKSVYVDALRRDGHWGVGEALENSKTAKTLRSDGGKMVVTDGPYAETKEQLGGVVVLHAKDMNHAIELMTKHPGIRSMASIEIRPVNEEINALIAAGQPETAASRG